jgi:pyridoxine 4-dehydrogenase
MTDKARPGGISSIGTAAIARVGYGAMQLFETSGEDAAAVLRRAVELGVNHIDTASFYGPGEVNRRIRAALAPYPEDLVIVSKVGARFTGEEPIPLAPAQRPAELRAAVEDDLRQLGLDRIPVVNLRRLDLGPGLQAEDDQIVDVDDQLAEMIALRDEGKIGAIGISAVPLDVLRRALPAGIVCVQNAYSLIDRTQEEMLDFCVAEDIAWVPYFPLGSAFPGFPKVADNPVVVDIAGELGATPAQVGLAWVLAHAPNTLLIPGTRSIAHLEENMGAGYVPLGADALARLDGVTAPGDGPQLHGLASFQEPFSRGADRLTTVADMADAGDVTPPWWLKPANKVFILMTRLGLSFGGESPVVLTVPGRKSGTPRSTPVTPMTVDGNQYVVAGFPGADWVRNVRAAGEVAVARGRKRERVRMVELSADDARPFLRVFPTEVPTGVGFIKRAGLVTEGRPDEFEALAGRCAVFRLDPV